MANDKIKITDLPDGDLQATDFFLKVDASGQHRKVTGQEVIDTIKEPLVQEIQVERLATEAAAAATEQNRILAENAKNDAVLAQNPLGDWNPATNTPTLTATPAAGPDGSWYDLTATANATFAGTNFSIGTSLKKGGRLVKKGTAYYYREPVDRSMEFSQVAIAAAAAASDQVDLTLRPLTVTAHNRADSTGAVIAVGDSAITYDETTGVITTVGSSDTVDSRAEYWETDLIMKANQKVWVEITIGTVKTTNPAVGLGFVGGPIALYRKDGSIGYITRSSGGVSLPYAVAAGSAWLAGDVIKVVLFNTGGTVNAEYYKNGVKQFGFAFPSATLENSRVLLFQRGSLNTTQKMYTAAEESAMVKTAKAEESPYVTPSVNLLPKRFSVGSYGSTGVVVASTTWKRSDFFVKVKPSTTYLLLGIDTIFPGNEYDGSGVRIKDIAVNNPTTPYTSVLFTTGSTTVLLGINIQSAGRADTTNTAMLVEGAVVPAAYEDYGAKYLQGPKIKGNIAGALDPSDLVPIQNTISSLTAQVDGQNTKLGVVELTPSKNIFNPANILSGNQYYSFSTGNVSTNTGWHGTSLIPIVEGNGPWLNIQGIATIFIGNIYNASQARILAIGDNVSLKTFVSVQIPPGGVFLGLNYQANGYTVNPADVMVWYSATQQTAPIAHKNWFAPKYLLPYANVVNGPEPVTAEPSPIYYSFNPTGGTNSAGQFMVYSRYPGTDLYNGYVVEHVVNSGIRADLWRIKGGNIYSRNAAGQMLIDSTRKILHDAESEYVYQIASASDHTGGYHGDELLTSIKFFANGVPLSLVSTIALTACQEFYYVQKSETYNPADASGTPTSVATHTKRTTFTKNNPGYRTNNKLRINVAVTIFANYAGLTCTAPLFAEKYFTKNLDEQTPVVDDALHLDEKGDPKGQLNYYNATTGFSAKIESEFLKVIQNGVDATLSFVNDSMVTVFDRSTDTKYYHRVYQNRAYVAGDTIEAELRAEYYKN